MSTTTKNNEIDIVNHVQVDHDAPPPLRPPLLRRLRATDLQRIDYAIAFLLLLIALPHLNNGLRGGIGVGWTFGITFGAALPIALRRRWPLQALVLATVAIGIATALGGFTPDLLIAVPMYQYATARERKASVYALIIVSMVLLVATTIGVVSHPNHGEVTISILVAIAAWFVGDSVRTRREYVAGLAEQQTQRERESVERAQRGLAEERLRIARELHDVVAHSLSVIAVQSGMGRHVIDDQPDQAKQALAAVETTSRAALDELRRILGVLRRGESDGVDLVPAPGIADLDELFAQIRATDIEVEVRIDHDAIAQLSPSIELTIYRIVQEALTNVVKHAGKRATAQVELRRDHDEIVIEITDGGGTIVPPYPLNEQHDHHGIIGMRERVASFGGSLVVGPRPGGGYRVLARIPGESVAS